MIVLRKIRSRDGSLDVKKGKQVIPINSEYITIIFDEPFSSVDYILIINLVNTIDGNPAVYPYIVNSKTLGSFAVCFQGEIDSNNYVIEWIAIM